MNFDIFYILRDKKNWWVDVILYFCVSLLIAIFLCYLIFALKVNYHHQKIEEKQAELLTVGTAEQKEMEQSVFEYQEKVKDFAVLIGRHQAVSNIFRLLETYTLPNVWFSKMNLERGKGQIIVSGESDTLSDVSRQIAMFEEREDFKKIDLVSSSESADGKTSFNLTFSFEPKVFAYNPVIEEMPDLPEADTTDTVTQETPIFETEEDGREIEQVAGTAKFMTSFDFPLEPEVVGVIDQSALTVSLEVPYGTDVTKLKPEITVSTNASVSPASGIEQDFTNPLVYTVTAQDLSWQKYTISVKVLPKDEREEQKPVYMQKFFIILVTGFALLIVILSGVFLFIRQKAKDKLT